MIVGDFMDNKKIVMGLIITILFVGVICALVFNEENNNLDNGKSNSTDNSSNSTDNSLNNSINNSLVTNNFPVKNEKIDNKMSGLKSGNNAKNPNNQKSKPWNVAINSKKEAINVLKNSVYLEEDLEFGNNGKTIKRHIVLENGDKFIFYEWKVPVYNTSTNKIVDYYTIGEDGLIKEYFS